RLTSIRDAARVQALALGLAALAAACAALLALAQMTARSVAAVSADLSLLRTLGLHRLARARLAAASFVPTAVGGAIVAVVAAGLASPLFPAGVTRLAGPPPGIRFDAVVLVPGALAF